jgi:hypothetical protein
MRLRTLPAIAVLAPLVACGPAHPLGVWFPREERVSSGAASCAPPETVIGCRAAPVPDSRDDGPRAILGDTQGMPFVTVSGDRIHYTQGVVNDVESICRLDPRSGAVLCFASVTPFDLKALHDDGTWLRGLVSGPREGPVLARISRDGGDVEYQRFLEGGEWPVEVAPFGDGVCVLVGRPGPGHAEHAVVRVPGRGGPRAVLVPFGHAHSEAIACDAMDAYFAGDDGLARVPLRGGTPVMLGTSAYRIALGPNEVYAASDRGIERLAKGSVTLTLVAKVARPRTDFRPVRAMRAFPGGVAWSERTFPHRWPDETATAIRWCREPGGCEPLAESDGELTLQDVQGGVVYWTARTKTSYGDTTMLYAARGPAKLKVAGDGAR